MSNRLEKDIQWQSPEECFDPLLKAMENLALQIGTSLETVRRWVFEKIQSPKQAKDLTRELASAGMSHEDKFGSVVNINDIPPGLNIPLLTLLIGKWDANSLFDKSTESGLFLDLLRRMNDKSVKLWHEQPALVRNVNNVLCNFSSYMDYLTHRTKGVIGETGLKLKSKIQQELNEAKLYFQKESQTIGSERYLSQNERTYLLKMISLIEQISQKAEAILKEDPEASTFRADSISALQQYWQKVLDAIHRGNNVIPDFNFSE